MKPLSDLRQEIDTLLKNREMEAVFGMLKPYFSPDDQRAQTLKALEKKSKIVTDAPDNGVVLDQISQEIGRLFAELNPDDDEQAFFEDPRDGQKYRTVCLNGQTWMADNLNFAVAEGGWFYQKKEKNQETYGRLYTWEAASEACPPGWRLPTNEDWIALIQLFGGPIESYALRIAADTKKAFQALVTGGESGFEALLGGWYIPSTGVFSNIGLDGSYLSATEASTKDVWCYTFNGMAKDVRRSRLFKNYGLSVRCIAV